MTSPKLWNITRNEFRITAANKAFVIMTILGPFLILAITILPSLMALNKPAVKEEARIQVHAPHPALAPRLTEALGAQGFKVVPPSPLADARAAILDRSLDYVLEVPADLDDTTYTLHSTANTDFQLYGLVEATVTQVATEIRAAEAGIDLRLVRQLTARGELRVSRVAPGSTKEVGGSDDLVATLFTVLTFMMMIYMTILLYGQMIGRSVVTEKTSKTVEIMLSSVRPTDLMLGKILGLGFAGILQYSIWVGLATALRAWIAPALGMALPAALSIANLLWLAVFFVLGFFLYAAIYAALGAAAEDEQHLAQLAWPALIFLIIPLVMINTFVSAPQEPLVVALSWFPLTSPIVMLARILVQTPPWWEIATSLLILVASIGLVVVGAARIFRVGILLTGKKPKLAELLRWLKEAKA